MTASARDGEGLLAAVRAEPGADLPRLVYADWCEDNGDVARAEFIRAQVQLAVIDAIPHDCGKGGEGETTCPACGAASVREELAAAEDELVRSHAWRWLRDGLPGRVWRDYDRWEHKGGLVRSRRDDAQHVEFRRGFLALVRCPAGDWIGHGKELLAMQPVERAELSDKRPWVDSPEADCARYWREADGGEGHAECAWVLPGVLFDRLPGHVVLRDGGRAKEFWGEDGIQAGDRADDAVSQALLALHKPAPR